jgi:hypothetical protein
MGIARKMIAVLSTRAVQRLETSGGITQLRGASRLAIGDTITLAAPKEISGVKWKVVSAPEFVSHKGKKGTQSGWSVKLEEIL